MTVKSCLLDMTSQAFPKTGLIDCSILFVYHSEKISLLSSSLGDLWVRTVKKAESSLKQEGSTVSLKKTEATLGPEKTLALGVPCLSMK